MAGLLLVAAGMSLWWHYAQDGPDGELVRVTAFGPNPTALDMHLYVPPQVAANPAVLLALHWCTGNGPVYFTDTDYANLADEFGFIVIYPSVTRASRCWDVHSTAALTHGGGSDPQGLLSMINHVIEQHRADRGRVFVAGHSSGGMMTQLLLGTYPEVFQAGAASAGVPLGCFAGEAEWSEDCARGRISRSAEEWASLVWRASPAYTGMRPRVQLWHGTLDDTLYFQNFDESIKQWTRVLETGAQPAAIDHDKPSSRWTRQRYAAASGEVKLEAYRGEGVPHNFTMPEREVLRFFGLAAARENADATH